MAENLIQTINWQRIGLNALAVFAIVLASTWGSNDIFIALKAAVIASLLALGRELQEALKGDTTTAAAGKKDGFKLSSWLLF